MEVSTDCKAHQANPGDSYDTEMDERYGLTTLVAKSRPSWCVCFTLVVIALICAIAPPVGLLLSGKPEPRGSLPFTASRCRQFGVCEVYLDLGPDEEDVEPFDVELHGTFTGCPWADGCTAEELTSYRVRGFYDGDGRFIVRFSPPQPGVWEYNVSSEVLSLNLVGSLTAATAPTSEHGPVYAVGHYLVHADGTPHVSVGTTCYAWAHHNETTRQATVATLRGRGRPFNKMRMTIFPKWYVYNHEEPQTHLYPLEGTPPRSWKPRRYNISFWRAFEQRVIELRNLGVVADIILFHPYDKGHWGFDCLGGNGTGGYDVTNDEHYLRYTVARLAAFSNVWWSMANEWDFVECKAGGLLPNRSMPVPRVGDPSFPTPVWDALFEVLQQEDPYQRLSSIHNGRVLYNHSRPWISHVSLQGREDQTAEIVSGRFGVKPVIWDEVKYEGDIPLLWGALTGPQMADRFWWGYSLGVYVGHSETYLQPSVRDDDQVMWWSKGGVLRGSAPARIEWFRQYVTDAHTPEFRDLEPYDCEQIAAGCNCTGLVLSGEFALFRLQPEPAPPGVDRLPITWCNLTIPGLPEASKLHVTAIHWWRMIKDVINGNASEYIMIKAGGWNTRPPLIELRRVHEAPGNLTAE